jgi:hypothetical protein
VIRPVPVALVEVSVYLNVQGGMSTIRTGQLLMLSSIGRIYLDDTSDGAHGFP